MKDKNAKYQKYKILHLTTGLYIKRQEFFDAVVYSIVTTPTIFEYKIPYKNMCNRIINRAIKDTEFYFCEEYDINEFEIIEIE